MIRTARRGFLLLAAVLIGFGVFGGGDLTVWRKAALICLECVGLG